jgi:hypothetical protein
MNDQQLMQEIKNNQGAAITTAVGTRGLPAAFLAALIANESGGDPLATRYEPAVFKRLRHEHPQWDDDHTRANATSWGLTQIMGYNYPGAPVDLANPGINLSSAVKMLEGFAQRFQLDVTKDFVSLFHCWNSGEPRHATFDPKYSAKGLVRMKVYEGL